MKICKQYTIIATSGKSSWPAGAPIHDCQWSEVACIENICVVSDSCVFRRLDNSPYRTDVRQQHFRLDSSTVRLRPIDEGFFMSDPPCIPVMNQYSDRFAKTAIVFTSLIVLYNSSSLGSL